MHSAIDFTGAGDAPGRAGGPPAERATEPVTEPIAEPFTSAVPAPPRWLGSFGDRLFSTDPKRRIRLVQTAIAIAITLSSLGVMQYIAWAGYAPWRLVVPWTLVALSGYAGFFMAIRTGWSERCTDPSLTVAQMVYALGCCASGYALAGPMRGTMFPLAMVVLMFGMFALTPRQMLAISVFAVVLFGTVMVAMCRLQPQTFGVDVELGHFLMLAAMMPAMSVLAAQLSRLRARLKSQARSLTEALKQNQVLATRDDLTGLVNRRLMCELLEKEQQRAARHGTGFCVAVLDLDHFKRVNDTHGHAAGDAVLKAVALEGARALRGTDTLGRWGGEEFVLLMPGTSLQAASEVTERLRRALEHLLVPAGDSVVMLTVSAGVAEYRPGEAGATVVERADRALYQAKGQGRNRVVAG